MRVLALHLVAAVAAEGPPLEQCAAAGIIHNHSGCSAAGHYASSNESSAAHCCARCAAEAQCAAWTWHSGPCYLTVKPKVATNSGTAEAVCGCKRPDCAALPVKCKPVYRPPKPRRLPLPPGKTQPHFVTVLVDDLGFDDASFRRGAQKGARYTPNMQALADDGIILERHHTYLWCSPTRRAFLTGRFPAHITGTQAPTCSNLTPLQYSLISEKLAAVGYESIFVGKGCASPPAPPPHRPHPCHRKAPGVPYLRAPPH